MFKNKVVSLEKKLSLFEGNTANVTGDYVQFLLYKYVKLRRVPGSYIQDAFSQGKKLVEIAVNKNCTVHKRSSFVLEQLKTIERINSCNSNREIDSPDKSEGKSSVVNKKDCGIFIEEPAIMEEINGLKMRSQSQDFEALANKLEVDMNNIPKALIIERNNFFDKTLDQIQTCITNFHGIANKETNIQSLKELLSIIVSNFVETFYKSQL